jgi:putative ABC transport system permease protein
MLKNYIKVALRGFVKSKGASFINILGLAIGLSCFTMIYVYVQSELSYDKFHKDSSHIFRVTTIDKALGVSSNNVGITNPIMTHAAEQGITDIIASTRISGQGRVRILNGEHEVFTEDAKSVETSFFDMFNFPLKEGSDTSKFSAPRKVILSSELADRTFKNEPAIGEIVRINEEDWEVVGVMEEINEKSHLKLDLLMSLYPSQADSSRASYLSSWRGLGMLGYIKVSDPAKSKEVEDQMNVLSHANEVPEFWVTKLQALEDAHLQSSQILFDGNNNNKGDVVYVYSLSAIAIFVILIAAFNFMNLSTAKSSTRAKEVGVRKVLGAQRQSLINQHLSESILVCLIALLLSFIMIGLVSPYAQLGFEENILSYLSSNSQILLFIVIVTLGIGVLAGVYPAFVLSGFNAVNILRGNFQTSKSGVALRKVLVVMQFVVSITLIVATLFINKQLDFLKKKSLGFSKEQIVNVRMNDQTLSQNMVAFRNQLLEYEGIADAGMSNNMPGRTFGRTGVTPEGVPEDEENWIVSALSFDEHYLDVMDMEVIDGRNYSPEHGTDEQDGILVNEAFIRQVGWSDALGKKLTMGNDQERTIIGIVKDFHFASMRHSIEPLIMFYNPDANGNLSIKINENTQAALTHIESVWSGIYGDYPFEYQFFEQEFAQMFESDDEFSGLVINFTWLAIFIACLGLFGLSSYMAEQRSKEIGIRKVLGSSVTQVVQVLTKEFVILILMACVLAIPVSYMAVSSWISEFQYKIDLLSISSMLTFALAGFLALTIGLLTVSYQSIYASLANPVNSIRSE